MHFGVCPIPVCPRPSRMCCSSCSCTCIPSSCVTRRVWEHGQAGEWWCRALSTGEGGSGKDKAAGVGREGCWSGKLFGLGSWGRDWRSRSSLRTWLSGRVSARTDAVWGGCCLWDRRSLPGMGLEHWWQEKVSAVCQKLPVQQHPN